jgi:hypothetical protein
MICSPLQATGFSETFLLLKLHRQTPEEVFMSTGKGNSNLTAINFRVIINGGVLKNSGAS